MRSASFILKVLCDFLELADGVIRATGIFTNRVFQAVIDMIVHEVFLGTANCFFHRLKLLCNFKATSVFLQHREDAIQVALSPLEPFDYFGVGGVFRHGLCILSSWGGCDNINILQIMYKSVDYSFKNFQNAAILFPQGGIMDSGPSSVNRVS